MAYYSAKSKLFISLLLLVFSVYLSGCASTKVNDPRDPYESMNRKVFNFNEKIDKTFIEPVARTYERFVPDPIIMVVDNAYSNIDDVVIAANSLLQLNFESTAVSVTRFLINSTFGLLGAVDVASDWSEISDFDFYKRNEDFGQTLGHYGIASGPYLVVPLMGSSSVRDVVGKGIDGLAAHPVTTIAYFRGVTAAIRTPVAAGMALNERVQLLGVDKTLEEAALDKYEFVRDAYLQRRASLVRNEDVDLEGE